MTNDNHAHSRANVIDLAELREAKRAAQEIAPDQFGDGPWRLEPNHAEWIDVDTGYPCMVVRDNMLGQLCGYVGVFQSHPCYGHHYDDGSLDRVSVHGGLTYSSFKGGRRRAQIVKVGEPWWFGFDCAHAGDLIPALDVGALKEFKAQLDSDLAARLSPEAQRILARDDRANVYRTFAWVSGEVGELAAQLRELE